MEEEYYNTQSLASGGGTIPQRFFYGVERYGNNSQKSADAKKTFKF